MHYREANIKFLVLKQGMEGLEQGDAAPCPLCIFPVRSSEKEEYDTTTCKICANQAVKASAKHQVFIYTCSEE